MSDSIADSTKSNGQNLKNMEKSNKKIIKKPQEIQSEQKRYIYIYFFYCDSDQTLNINHAI